MPRRTVSVVKARVRNDELGSRGHKVLLYRSHGEGSGEGRERAEKGRGGTSRRNEVNLPASPSEGVATAQESWDGIDICVQGISFGASKPRASQEKGVPAPAPARELENGV